MRFNHKWAVVGLLSLSACTSAQVKSDAQQAAADARVAIAAYKANQGTIDAVIAKTVAIAPQTGTAHAVAVDAAATATLLQQNPALIDSLDQKLAQIDGSQK